MCAEGDVLGMSELIQDISSSFSAEDGDLSPSAIIRYQDPFSALQTGLHITITKQQRDAVFLLLWLGSSIPDREFPDFAETYVGGVSRTTAEDGVDIRGIVDAEGRSPATLLVQSGVQFEGFERWLGPAS